MNDTSTDGVDPRFPRAFQRGGDDTPVVVPSPARQPTQPSHVPQLDDDVVVTSPTPSASRLARDDDGVRHFEVVIAGNPWLRGLWAVGAVALVAALALAVYAEYAFSAAQSEGLFGPNAYLAPRIAQTLVLPLSIAGVIALVAAMVLRIVAWRPSGARELEAP